ncbi:MAG: aldo/keto reductase [Bacteroidota bacterium]
MTDKLALGSAQFGLPYGINNKSGMVTDADLEKIFRFSRLQRIDTIDTAHAYGVSEQRIGEHLRGTDDFRVVSKVSAGNSSGVHEQFSESLARLHQKRLYGYLVHDFVTFEQHRDLWSALVELREQGRVEKIGFSLYYPSQLDVLLDLGLEFDLVQFPYSIFDQRFSPYFAELQRRHVEVHARSVFLQGLAFLNPETLRGPLLKARRNLNNLRALSEKSSLKIEDLCLNFVLLNIFISRAVVGIDNAQQLERLAESELKARLVESYLPVLKEFRVDDEDVLLPMNWNLSA